MGSCVPEKLERVLGGIPKAALAFSGGADSSYLLYAAKSCHMDLRAYYVNSQFQPGFELEDARRMAFERGVKLSEIALDVLRNPGVAANGPERCYICKQVIFGEILARAAEDGYTVLMDGSNFSDDAGNRPGMRALRELSVRSPLREAEMTKEDVRRYSLEAGLFTFNKPAYACLATRVLTGDTITDEILSKIESAEDTLFNMGFSDFRARVIGPGVKLQFPAEQIPRAARRYAEITRALSPLFGDILLDLSPR